MALPKLNAVPKYEITIPSTKQTVKYRPYLVKEEKVLMLAMESQDQRSALNAIVDTIGSCVQEEIDITKLTTFDVEYLFTQIRSKSVGETSKIGIRCTHCDHMNEVTVKLDDIKVEVPEGLSTKVQLTDDITLQLRWPTYNEIIDVENQSSTEQTFKMDAACIDSVQTEEENIRLRDEPEKEVMAFIESLSSAQFDKVREFIEAMPKMEHTVNFECEECKKGNQQTLAGIADFF